MSIALLRERRLKPASGIDVSGLRIDRGNPTPVYAQIAGALKALIEEHQLQPGDLLPPERVLCEQFGVTRMTLRQACDLLGSEGLIERQRGRGTFVCPRRVEKQQQNMRSFSEEIRSRGGVPSSRMLSFRLVDADSAAQRFFGLGEQEQVYELRRVRLMDGKPLALETTRVPHRLCSDLRRFDFAHESLYVVLEEHCRLRLARCVEEISARLPNRQECELLHIPKSIAVFSIHRKTYTQEDVPVELGNSIFRGDLYSVIVHSVRTRERTP